MKSIILWSHYGLFAVGISALGYCAIATCTASHFQVRARQKLFNGGLEPSLPSSAPGPIALPFRAPFRAGSGMSLVGRVDVPRVHLSAMVADGTTARVLRVAVGHVPGTAMPWQSGNVTLVAHRDTFFRRLGELIPGDMIHVTVPGAEYFYRVTFTDVVDPHETWVLQPATGDTLTLITCYPFHFIGSAPKRFVVRARRLASDVE
jgi:sortase A